jgi:hypothetical protein
MLTMCRTALRFLQARWRWVRGRCPRCNRDFHATPIRQVASEPLCLVCKDETTADLRVWHAYRRSELAPAPAFPA